MIPVCVRVYLIAIVVLVPAVPATLYAQGTLVTTRPLVTPGDLASIRVMDTARHLVFRVYFDSTSQPAAMATIPTLAEMYAQIAHELGAEPSRVEWAAVAFVNDTGYVSPRVGREVRWTVGVERSGSLGPRGERNLYVVLPHEQAHSIQGSMTDGLPRWFQEGQAEWAGLRVTERWRPVLAEEQRQEKAATFGDVPRRLSAWGGIRVKPEAILRQMTPEQRARRAQDSTYMPPGPWTLGSADFISDESELAARYGAALALFTKLERTRGANNLTAWFRELWTESNSLTTPSLIVSARQRFGVDISGDLR